MEYVGVVVAMILCEFCWFGCKHINDGYEKHTEVSYKTVTYNGNGLEDLEIKIEKEER